MNNKEFKYITTISKPISDVFEFYSNPKNINKLTPWFVNVVAIPDKRILVGSIFEIKISIFGINSKWKILIKHFEENKIFTDLQLEGPFLYWEHNHIFELNNQKTIMKDVIKYKSILPFVDKIGFLTLVFKFVFYYRKRKILSIFQEQK
tara:strand:- start:1211 stop:1657 length:447 start_codon:yes stop_codon:yes gene_type:complete